MIPVGPANRTRLYDSDVGADVIANAVAETVDTVVLIYASTAVAALLARPAAGRGYDSLATPLAFWRVARASC